MQNPVPLDPDDATANKLLNVLEIRPEVTTEPLEHAAEEISHVLVSLQNKLNQFNKLSASLNQRINDFQQKVQDLYARY